MDNLKIIHCGIRKPGFSDHLESIILEEQIYNLKGLRILQYSLEIVVIRGRSLRKWHVPLINNY